MNVLSYRGRSASRATARAMRLRLLVAATGLLASTLTAQAADSPRFDGLWTAKVCDSMRPAAFCTRVDLDLVDRKGRVCGRYTRIAISDGSVQGTADPIVRGQVRGDVAIVVLGDGDSRLVELRRRGTTLQVDEVAPADGRTALRVSMLPSRDASSTARVGSLRDACEQRNGDTVNDERDPTADVRHRQRADPASVPFETCMAHAQGDREMSPCYAAELDRVRARHARLLERVRGHYAAGHAAAGQDFAASRTAFERAEAAWAAYRDAHCESRDAAFGLGTARALDEVACRIDAEVTRNQALEELLLELTAEDASDE